MRSRVPSPTHAWSPVAWLLAVALIGQASVVSAQTPFVPYFGKNNIHYDKFDWHIYTTDHFEIYYYPELERQLERIAGYAESAYQQVSADLKHDLPFKVPLILFKTHSEFEQQNVAPGATFCCSNSLCVLNRSIGTLKDRSCFRSALICW